MFPKKSVVHMYVPVLCTVHMSICCNGVCELNMRECLVLNQPLPPSMPIFELCVGRGRLKRQCHENEVGF